MASCWRLRPSVPYRGALAWPIVPRMNGPGFDRRMLRLMLILATLGALAMVYGLWQGVPR